MLRCYGVTALRCHTDIASKEKSLQKEELGTGRGEGLGETDSFVRGKWEFRLGRVWVSPKESPRGWNRLKNGGFRAKMVVVKLLYILLNCHTDHTDSHRFLWRDDRKTFVILQKLRSVKTENNLEEMGKMLGLHTNNLYLCSVESEEWRVKRSTFGRMLPKGRKDLLPLQR